MQTRLGGAGRNLQNGGDFFECEVVLVTKQEHGSAGGRDVLKQEKEALVGWLAKVGIGGAEVVWWSVVQGTPAAGMFEVREGDTGSYAEGPGAKYGGFTQEG